MKKGRKGTEGRSLGKALRGDGTACIFSVDECKGLTTSFSLEEGLDKLQPYGGIGLTSHRHWSLEADVWMENFLNGRLCAKERSC